MRHVLVTATACLIASSAVAAPATSDETIVKDVAAFARNSNVERQDVLTQFLRTHQLPVEVEPFVSGDDPPEKGANVITSVGSGATDIVLSAHYDAKALRAGGFAPGAVDNAAAIVALVRAAEALKHHHLRHRVVLVFFDQEETGFGGSKRFVASRPLGRIAGAVNLDIAGYGDTLFYPRKAAPGAQRLAQLLRATCPTADLACVDFENYPDSDDQSFDAAGWPNISLSVLPRAEVYQLWLKENAGSNSGLASGFRPAFYQIVHSKNDTVDHVDPKTVRMVADFTVKYVLKMDQDLR